MKKSESYKPLLNDTVWMILAIIVILLNMIASRNTAFISIVSIVEFFICLVMLLVNKIRFAFIFFIFFLSNCLEVQYFVTGIREMDGTFYNFSYLPVLGRHGMLLLTGLMYIILLLKNGYKSIRASNNRKLSFLHCANHYLIIVGLMLFVLLYLFNDNGIQYVSWYISLSLKHIERSFIIFFTVEVCILLLINDNRTLNELTNMMEGSLFALPIAGFAGAIFGLTGSRGFVGGLSLLPIYSSLGVYLFLFVKYEKDVLRKVLIVMFSLLLTAYLIIFPTQLGGKFIISIVVTALFVFYIRKSKFALLIVAIAGLGVFFIFESGLLELLFANNAYMLSKITEAKSITSLFGGNVQSADVNVAFRFDEFANTFQEYLNKPYYFIFGKGIGGTILHHTSTYSWSDAGSFTPDQVSSGIFMELHETINVVFLKYGLLGLIGLAVLIIGLLKSLKRSKWALIGLTWLLFYFGIYYSMFFGLVAMVVAIFEGGITENKTVKALSNNNSAKIYCSNKREVRLNDIYL